MPDKTAPATPRVLEAIDRILNGYDQGDEFHKVDMLQLRAARAVVEEMADTFYYFIRTGMKHDHRKASPVNAPVYGCRMCRLESALRRYREGR